MRLVSWTRMSDATVIACEQIHGFGIRITPKGEVVDSGNHLMDLALDRDEELATKPLAESNLPEQIKERAFAHFLPEKHDELMVIRETEFAYITDSEGFFVRFDLSRNALDCAGQNKCLIP